MSLVVGGSLEWWVVGGGRWMVGGGLWVVGDVHGDLVSMCYFFAYTHTEHRDVELWLWVFLPILSYIGSCRLLQATLRSSYHRPPFLIACFVMNCAKLRCRIAGLWL